MTKAEKQDIHDFVEILEFSPKVITGNFYTSLKEAIANKGESGGDFPIFRHIKKVNDKTS